MKTSYDERDYPFGQAMLTLRTAIGLTQAGLANRLGVSRRAVGEWEAGKSYPKAEHLKQVIALAVERQAFSGGNEAQEIRALWKVAHQKVLLDEHWVFALLDQWSSSQGQSHRELHVESAQVVGLEHSGSALRLSGDKPLPFRVVPMTPMEETLSGPSTMTHHASGPHVDWGDALAVPIFYGREQEMAQLTQWIVQEHCRVVSVLGMGGIGKSALSVSTMYQLAAGTGQAQESGASPDPTFPTACPFEVVIFRSLRDAPSCEALLDDCLQVLEPQQRSDQSTSLDQRISLLLSLLRKMRTLLVLDNLESLLQEGDVRGHFLPGFEGYGRLLHQVAEAGHQSCLLLTSREKPTELRLLEGQYPSVRSLRLTGLDSAACLQLFAEKGLVGTFPEQERLIEIYGGNPLALKIVAETIVDLFGGEISLFLTEETLIFGSIADLLSEQFVRLSALEKTVLYWLAIAREPMTLDELLELLVSPQPRVRVLEALDSLRRRSLVDRGKRASSFTLQAVVLEYVTASLIAEASSEIQQHQLDRLIRYGLSQARASEYVRQTQERLLLSPILAHMQAAYLRRTAEARQLLGTCSTVPVEEQLLGLLDELRGEVDSAQGYGPANLIALLRLRRGNLNGLDLSHLCIREASLQGIELQDAKLSGALIRDSIFTQAVGVTWSVAISLDGKWWATGSMQGQVCIWEGVRSQTLRLIWQAHTDVVSALAFSPDGRTLASGSMDDTVKLWDMEACSRVGTSHSSYDLRNALLWTSWQNGPQVLAFSPDGRLLASGGLDRTVQLWEVGRDSHGASPHGKNVQTLTHPSHVFAVAFSPDGRLLASGCVDGQMRLWERQEGTATAFVPLLEVESNWVSSLAFAPDGRTLASTSRWDQTVHLWEVPSLRLLHTLPEHADQSKCVAWSPDSSTVAYSRSDKAIWLWDVQEGRGRAMLHGHTADVRGMVFTPDGRSLLSGSADGTLRVWDVESCQCMRVMTGYGVSLWDIDWSPDGTGLISGGTDGLVTIWDIRGEISPKILQGHNWIVSGVGWSPDGKYLSSCSLNPLLLLWNAVSHACVQRFEMPSVVFQSVAWSPNGNLLACGTYGRGIQVWDMAARRLRWVGQPFGVWFLHIVWSPDGTRLAGAAHDGSVYLWEAVGDVGQEQDKGETSSLPTPTKLLVSVPSSESRKGIDSRSLPTGEVYPPNPNGSSGNALGHHGNVMSVAWSPDGKLLASGSNNGSSGELFLWDMQNVGTVACSSPLRTFAEHPGRVYALAWSRSHGACPRRDLLISGGNDGKLCWWNVQSGECVGVQTAHQGTIRSLKVSPDGRWLASCGDDGAIKIWDLTSRDHLRTLRRDRPYERLNISGIRGLNEAEIASLRALGAIEEGGP